MELLNATKMVAGYTQGMLQDARELLIVVVKGTFSLPRQGERVTLAKEQLPLVTADLFTGEPGLSAPLYESDYAPTKPYCDIVVNGSAYAPGGKPASQVGVGIKVGRVAKAFHVVGDRVWESASGSLAPGDAVPYVKKPFSYDVAYGGTDRISEDESAHDAFLPNPIGVGFHKGTAPGMITGKPVPSTEERKNPVKSPNGDYVPMSLGPVARAWQPRARYAGTYDDAWLDEMCPFLPHDLDTRYFQCAPEDQQTDHLQGGEEVTLINLTPDGRREFQIPTLNMPIVFFRQHGEQIHTKSVIDTLYIEPDNERFVLTWRAHLPLKKNIFEVKQVIIGEMSRARKRARELGKAYYPGLAAAVKSRTGSTDVKA